MADRANFTPEEWARVVASPMVATMAITAADPSGLWGLLKESMSGGWSMLDVKKDATANVLAKAVADDMTDATVRSAVREHMQSAFQGAGAGGSATVDVKTRAVDELRTVAQLVDAKAPADAPGFKAWLQHVANEAAKAGVEGGFLGFGGVAVSDAEKATLDEIAAALGSSAPSPGGSAI
jgi:hypothetical protein